MVSPRDAKERNTASILGNFRQMSTVTDLLSAFDFHPDLNGGGGYVAPYQWQGVPRGPGSSGGALSVAGRVAEGVGSGGGDEGGGSGGRAGWGKRGVRVGDTHPMSGRACHVRVFDLVAVT